MKTSIDVAGFHVIVQVRTLWGFAILFTAIIKDPGDCRFIHVGRAETYADARMLCDARGESKLSRPTDARENDDLTVFLRTSGISSVWLGGMIKRVPWYYFNGTQSVTLGDQGCYRSYGDTSVANVNKCCQQCSRSNVPVEFYGVQQQRRNGAVSCKCISSIASLQRVSETNCRGHCKETRFKWYTSCGGRFSDSIRVLSTKNHTMPFTWVTERDMMQSVCSSISVDTRGQITLRLERCHNKHPSLCCHHHNGSAHELPPMTSIEAQYQCLEDMGTLIEPENEACRVNMLANKQYWSSVISWAWSETGVIKRGVHYTNWSEEQPHFLDFPSGSCTVLSRDGGWKVDICSERRNVVCETNDSWDLSSQDTISPSTQYERDDATRVFFNPLFTHSQSLSTLNTTGAPNHSVSRATLGFATGAAAFVMVFVIAVCVFVCSRKMKRIPKSVGEDVKTGVLKDIQPARADCNKDAALMGPLNIHDPGSDQDRIYINWSDHLTDEWNSAHYSYSADDFIGNSPQDEVYVEPIVLLGCSRYSTTIPLSLNGTTAKTDLDSESSELSDSQSVLWCSRDDLANLTNSEFDRQNEMLPHYINTADVGKATVREIYTNLTFVEGEEVEEFAEGDTDGTARAEGDKDNEVTDGGDATQTQRVELDEGTPESGENADILEVTENAIYNSYENISFPYDMNVRQNKYNAQQKMSQRKRMSSGNVENVDNTLYNRSSPPDCKNRRIPICGNSSREKEGDSSCSMSVHVGDSAKMIENTLYDSTLSLSLNGTTAKTDLDSESSDLSDSQSGLWCSRDDLANLTNSEFNRPNQLLPQYINTADVGKATMSEIYTNLTFVEGEEVEEFAEGDTDGTAKVEGDKGNEVTEGGDATQNRRVVLDEGTSEIADGTDVLEMTESVIYNSHEDISFPYYMNIRQHNGNAKTESKRVISGNMEIVDNTVYTWSPPSHCRNGRMPICVRDSSCPMTVHQGDSGSMIENTLYHSALSLSLDGIPVKTYTDAAQNRRNGLESGDDADVLEVTENAIYNSH